MRRRRRAAQLGLDARQQLDHLERLGDVVVGAELQADHLVDHLAARGQHDDRRLDAALAQLLADVEAVQPRQHHVEEDEIERLAGGALEAALAVGARFDRVALAREPVGQRQHQAGLVLDQQEPLHACDPVAAARLRRWRRGRPALRWRPAATTVNLLPSPGALLHGDPPAVRLDDPLHEAQAEAGARICAATTSGAR